jgi:hypothetical protein
MGLFDSLRHKKPHGDPLAGGADGCFDVLDAGGHLVRYLPDDFDEIWTTTDEHEAGHHVSIGWLLLDEVVGPGSGPGHVEIQQRAVFTGGAQPLRAQRPCRCRAGRRHDVHPRLPQARPPGLTAAMRS